MPAFRSLRATVLLCSMIALAGCAAPSFQAPRQPVALGPVITASDLKKAERISYDRGFEAGRHYQDKHGGAVNATPAADAAQDGAAQDGCAPPPASQQPTAVAPVAPVAPSSSYTTSGRAQPLPQ
ncbi:hypothetical protein [Acidocella sp.]|uniref:hypothetical protein n=1 Tax=Acidocella sp. TaxID=50710 RepID=UPI003CFC27D4